MITFPPEFVATRFPGYFWNVSEKKLYSIKVSGVLRPLVRRKKNKWYHWGDHYTVSVEGKKRYMSADRLEKLTPRPQVVPVVKE